MDDRLDPEHHSPGVPRLARGFLVTDDDTEPPVPGWITHEIAGLTISRAPEVALTEARSGRRFVVVLGHIVDTATRLSTEAAASGAAQALASSDDAFLDVIDGWSGRLLILFGAEADLAIHPGIDATPDRFLASSHWQALRRFPLPPACGGKSHRHRDQWAEPEQD
jgi:hypothetical protein